MGTKRNFVRIQEAEARTEHLHIESFEMHNSKKYGAFGWCENDSTVFLMEFDSVKDLASYYGVESEAWMDIDKIPVGQTVSDGAGNYYMRLW